MRVNTKSDDNQQEHEETKSLQLVDEARLTELYDLFETFTTLSDGESLDVESAIMVLDTTFSDPQELVNLLKTYHEDRVVFMQVVLAHREQFHPEMAQLIFYLVTKSPAILDLRLEDEEGSDSLLFEVCSEKEEYQTLYALLLSAFPDEIAKGEAMVADRKRACKTLYKQLAISMQRSDLERFSALVELADHLLLIDIIDTPTLEKWLLPANKEYFQVILRVLPVIIEKLLERDHKLVPLFDVLVSDPVLHHSALSILKEVHSQFLSHNRLLAINTALGIENHKTLPPAPQVQKLEKATEVLPSLFLTREQIEQFSQQLAAPPHEHRLFANPAVLIPDVNPDRLIEAEVLDALLFKPKKRI